MREEKYILNWENTNDITCIDPLQEKLYVYLYIYMGICAGGTADELI